MTNGSKVDFEVTQALWLNTLQKLEDANNPSRCLDLPQVIQAVRTNNPNKPSDIRTGRLMWLAYLKADTFWE